MKNIAVPKSKFEMRMLERVKSENAATALYDMPRKSRRIVFSEIAREFFKFRKTQAVTYHYAPSAPTVVAKSGVVTSHRKRGFTLIELSIILVVIGFLAGGILVGSSLIESSRIRAQIAQIEQYTAAVNTFKLKYNNRLPGDIPEPDASGFGFAARGIGSGQGDGNGFIACGYGTPTWGWCPSNGEEGMFWVDLSAAGLIDGNFSTAKPTVAPPSDVTGSDIDKYFPQAKIGGGNYVYVWSRSVSEFGNTSFIGTSSGNYFGISAVSNINSTANAGKITSSPKISVYQAYSIDSKIDDGYPKTGNVIAVYLNNDPKWIDGTNTLYNPIYTGSIQASPTSCYDNGNIAEALQQYSTMQSGGSGTNCALSFKMK